MASSYKSFELIMCVIDTGTPALSIATSFPETSGRSRTVLPVT